MNSVEELANIITPDLNFLLTGPPHIADDGGLDFGWFCREHAFCVCIAGAASGIPVRVIRGHVIADGGGIEPLSTIGTTSDHAWCGTSDVAVLDCSINFRAYRDSLQLSGPVCGTGYNGDINVELWTDNFQDIERFGDTPAIRYVPVSFLHVTPLELIANPLNLVKTDESATISLAVALHVGRLALGQTRPMDKTQKQSDALYRLVASLGDAKRQLLELIEQA